MVLAHFSRSGLNVSATEKYSFAEQVETSSFIHLPSEHLDPIDMSFECRAQTRGPRPTHVERSGDPEFVQPSDRSAGRATARCRCRPDALPLRTCARPCRSYAATSPSEFGREPGPEDPLFFDPPKTSPRRCHPRLPRRSSTTWHRRPTIR